MRVKKNIAYRIAFVLFILSVTFLCGNALSSWTCGIVAGLIAGFIFAPRNVVFILLGGTTFIGFVTGWTKGDAMHAVWVALVSFTSFCLVYLVSRAWFSRPQIPLDTDLILLSDPRNKKIAREVQSSFRANP
jgi:hypothetical protein